MPPSTQPIFPYASTFSPFPDPFPIIHSPIIFIHFYLPSFPVISHSLPKLLLSILLHILLIPSKFPSNSQNSPLISQLILSHNFPHTLLPILPHQLKFPHFSHHVKTRYLLIISEFPIIFFYAKILISHHFHTEIFTLFSGSFSQFTQSLYLPTFPHYSLLTSFYHHIFQYHPIFPFKIPTFFALFSQNSLKIIKNYSKFL